MSQWLVQDVMTRDVLTVTPQTPYREIVNALVQRRVTAAPVLDDDGRVAGVVSEADLLHKVEFIGDEHERRTFERPSRRAAREKAQAAVAADLMTAPAITVRPDVTVGAAARQMEKDGVKRLPVVDADGRLIGIVSRRDLLRGHLRPDPEIHDEIADDVLRRGLWIDPVAVQVDVVDGAVTLTGNVGRRSTAALVARMVADVPGVVGVTDRLKWDFDDSELVRDKGYTFDTPEKLFRPATAD